MAADRITLDVAPHARALPVRYRRRGPKVAGALVTAVGLAGVTYAILYWLGATSRGYWDTALVALLGGCLLCLLGANVMRTPRVAGALAQLRRGPRQG